MHHNGESDGFGDRHGAIERYQRAHMMNNRSLLRAIYAVLFFLYTAQNNGATMTLDNLPTVGYDEVNRLYQ